MKRAVLTALGAVLAGAASFGCGGAQDEVIAQDSTDGGSGEALATRSGSDALLAEAQRIASTLKSTHYDHTTHIDTSRGVYDVDCSGFVNYAMQVEVKTAFDELQAATTKRPVAESYTAFFDELSPPKGSWHEVKYVRDLVPGDIISWRIPAGVKSNDTGHVMIVEEVTGRTSSLATVKVIDSTDTGHGDADPRSPQGHSGIGRGTIGVVIAGDGTASGYRWSLDADSPPYETDVEMAHLD